MFSLSIRSYRALSCLAVLAASPAFAVSQPGDIVVATYGSIDQTTLGGLSRYNGSGAVVWSSVTQDPTFTYPLFSASGVAFSAQTHTLYASSFAQDSATGQYDILKYSTGGVYQGTLVTGMSVQPSSIHVGPNGDIYFSQYGGGNILEYTPAGAFVQNVVTGLSSGAGFAWGPNGDLYVNDFGAGTVSEYHNGSVIHSYQGPVGSGIVPEGMVFLPNGGDLLVSAFTTNQILKFNPNTLALDGVFATIPTVPSTGITNYPGGMIIDKSGNVMVAVLGADYNHSGQLMEYSTSGTLLNTFETGLPVSDDLVLIPEPSTGVLALLAAGMMSLTWRCRAGRCGARRERRLTRTRHSSRG